MVGVAGAIARPTQLEGRQVGSQGRGGRMVVVVVVVAAVEVAMVDVVTVERGVAVVRAVRQTPMS